MANVGIYNGNFRSGMYRELLRDRRISPSENPNHPNSLYWIKRLDTAMDVILDNPEMEKFWNSPVIPDTAHVMVHALLAEKIVSGEITSPEVSAAAVVPSVSYPENTPT